ncbi:beta-1,3-glucan-binding protein [Plodia interpunctella]|uniref:beta-1,3-glucan-binding protein n=1 Tax=Plodia interpunctella TaxID=58824 RepID=UPI002368D4FB|nr:beta-1,3-glucan-binding protein-like [Plodia interpunctella]
MSTFGSRRAICVIFVAIISIFAQDSYVIPAVRIQAFKPSGVRISIPDVPGITLFSFNGNINKGISTLELGQLRSEVTTPVKGKWTFVDPTIRLNVGDVVYYYVLVETGLIEGTIFVSGHYSGILRHRIEHLEDTSPEITTEAVAGCKPSPTEVYQGSEQICSGQVLLEDRFSTLNDNVWQIEHLIPIDNPEYPFVSYQRSSVSIQNRYLTIQAKLQENEPGFSNDTIYCGSLDLSDGCTEPQCSKMASGADILPPVVSGRLTSKGFAFKYGTVHVRAKLPIGDWVYPEIMLEPVTKKYGGMNYASGVLKVAGARGNENLVAGDKDYSNKVLYGGPIMSQECRDQIIQEYTQTEGKLWGNDFHIYSLRWTPDYISLSVDGKEWSHIDSGTKKLRAKFASHCKVNIPGNSTKMAPFDDFFYITLGLSIGGVTEFRDDVKTKDGYPKPWKNSSRKAMLNFWRDLNSWYTTWKQPKMIVDYVRVIAL